MLDVGRSAQETICEFLASELAEAARANLGGYFKQWSQTRTSIDIDDCNLSLLAANLVDHFGLENFMARTATQVIEAAEEHLRTAKLGLSDMRAGPQRRRSGLLNAVTFGRSATFALQNLSSIVPEFEEWYRAKQLEMRNDELTVYFNNLRREIEHAAASPGHGSTKITDFNLSRDKAKLGPAPAGSIGFFMGDRSGGAGWEVRLPDGTVQKYYVDIPEKIGTIDFHLNDAPGADKKNAIELVTEYLGRMESIVKEARQRFIR